ncbi:anti-sigma factor family protein [Alteraurantiacibacter buctensis]|uniref:Anti-sigma factor n=1 Tax=Alteraurantiacibacter buctensis TaxID=1503981 RepID=A0A844YU80_9SPHN|nr:anti-sigma factor [Alteraurantiacibacter buctensis]MXO70054.1 anti-sigma factor [Alteraurantiacibacter buctensis]
MTISENELAAFADGELTSADAARVEQAVAADPELARRLAAHRLVKDRLAGHFAPIMAEDPPERLTALLRPRPAVADLAAAREERSQRTRLPRWTWVAGPALAASLLIAVLVPGSGGNSSAVYADTQLATVLTSQLVANQNPDAQTRVLLSFVRDDGDYCRAYASDRQSGIACNDGSGWALVEQAGGATGSQGEYQQAGSSVADVLARAQDMAVGGALDAEAERAAQERGWHD